VPIKLRLTDELSKCYGETEYRGEKVLQWWHGWSSVVNHITATTFLPMSTLHCCQQRIFNNYRKHKSWCTESALSMDVNCIVWNFCWKSLRGDVFREHIVYALQKFTLRMTYDGSSLPIVLMYCATAPSKSPLLQTHLTWSQSEQQI